LRKGFKGAKDQLHVILSENAVILSEAKESFFQWNDLRKTAAILRFAQDDTVFSGLISNGVPFSICHLNFEFRLAPVRAFSLAE